MFHPARWRLCAAPITAARTDAIGSTRTHRRPAPPRGQQTDWPPQQAAPHGARRPDHAYAAAIAAGMDQGHGRKASSCLATRGFRRAWAEATKPSTSRRNGPRR